MKIRKQTFSLEQYLKLMQNETIRTDQDCQRLSGQWSNNMVNELISTVLTGNYIPPVILGEETSNGITRQWIIDGLQRSTSLSLFKYGNKRITKNVDEFMITYQRKTLDESGNVKRDVQGEIIWEIVEFDIRNKTYSQLPEELKDRFNEYQIETVIHQNCDIVEVSKLVKKYNNHTAMNTDQKAFTYIENFAGEIRRIAQNRFFLNLYSGSAKDRTNGKFERIICDMVILCNYPEEFKRETRKNFEWLNENASLYDFESVGSLLTNLTDSLEITPEIKELFNIKHVHIVVAAFKKFIELGNDSNDFGNFLKWFVDGGNEIEVDGKIWDSLYDPNHSTRELNVVLGKLDYMVALIRRYTEEAKKVA